MNDCFNFSIYILILICINSCHPKDESLNHEEAHEVVLIPFGYHIDFHSDQFIISVTPNDNSLSYFPVAFEIIDIGESGEIYADLLISNYKQKTELIYRHEGNDISGNETILELPFHDHVLSNDQMTLNLSIYLCGVCTKIPKVNNAKQHYKGHVVGKHFHVKWPR